MPPNRVNSPLIPQVLLTLLRPMRTMKPARWQIESPYEQMMNRHRTGKTDIFDLAPDQAGPVRDSYADRTARAKLAPHSAEEPLRVQIAKIPTTSNDDLPLLSRAFREHWLKRLLFVVLALSITAGYFFVNYCFWVPATGMPDENGYLVGGKMMARDGIPVLKPDEPYAYVGLMWMGFDLKTNPRFYPKYPLGLPALVAALTRIDHAHWKTSAYLISPIASSLAVLGMFFLTRLFTDSFFGICGMLLLATGQVTLELANTPDSHSPTLFFVVWGMYFLFSGWNATNGLIGWLRWTIAGLLLGYAATLRYSEGLLVLPVAAAAMLSIRGSLGSWFRSISLLVMWSTPVLLLVAFNWLAMHHLTGYDTTSESTGFTWAEFKDKWEYTLQQLYNHGMFLVLPLGFFGLLVMFRWSWRAALTLMLWFVPQTLLYTAYYWGEFFAGIPYLRFFATLTPPVIVGAAWLIKRASQSSFEVSQAPRGSVVAPLAGGALVAAAGALGIYIALPVMRSQQVTHLNVGFTADAVAHEVSPTAAGKNVRPVIFCSREEVIEWEVNQLQFTGDYDLYAINAFSQNPLGGWGWQAKPDQPHPLQLARQEQMQELYKGKSQQDLAREQHRIVKDALDREQPVFALLTDSDVPMFRRRFMTDGFDMQRVTRWKEPATIPTPGMTSPMTPVARFGIAIIFPTRPQLSWQLFRITYTKPADPSTAPQVTRIPAPSVRGSG